MSMKTNFLVDSIIFVAFLISFDPVLTGIAIHEWISLALAATFLLHILLHWDWVASVTKKFFKKLFHSSRLNYVIDLGVLISGVLVMLSGILISRSILPFLGITLGESHAWRILHSSSADAFLILIALHFALHWKWVLNALKRFISQPLRQYFSKTRSQNVAPAPATLEGKINDR